MTIREENVEYWDSESTAERYEEKGEVLKTGEKSIFENYLNCEGKLLELGCGSGRVTTHLEQMGHDTIATDLSRNMVEKAEKKLDSSSLGIMDASNLGFRANSFDYVVFAFNGIDYIHPVRERRKALSEIHRVLKPGGIFVFSTHNKFFVPTSVRSLAERFKSAVIEGSLVKDYYRVERDDDNPQSTYYTYHTTIQKQTRKLREFGFEILDVRDEKDTKLKKYIQPWIYFVARNPGE